MEASASAIKVYVQRDGATGFSSVYIDTKNDGAAAKKVVAIELGMINPLDEVTLWKADAVGELTKLSDRRLVEGQLEANDTVIVRVEVVRAVLGKRNRVSDEAPGDTLHTLVPSSTASSASVAWQWAQLLPATASSTVLLLSELFDSPPVASAPRVARHELSVKKLGGQFKFVNRLKECKLFAQNFGDMDDLRGRGFEAEKRNLKVVNVAGLSGIGKTCFVDAALSHLRDVYGDGITEVIWPGECARRVELMTELLSACDSQRNLRVTLNPAACAPATLDRHLGAALLSQWMKHCEKREGGCAETFHGVAPRLAECLASDTLKRLTLLADLTVHTALDIILAHASTIHRTASTFALTRRPAVIVHLDEAQQYSFELLKGAIELFSTALLTHGQRVFLVITGLPSADVEQALRWTSVASLDIVLPLLATEHMVEIVADLVGIDPHRVSVGIRNALWMLGGVPRFLEYLFASAARKAGTADDLGVQTTWEWLNRASLPDLSDVIQMTSRELYNMSDTPGNVLDALFSLAVSERSVPLSCVLDAGHASWTVARAQNARLVYWEGVPGGDGPIRMPPILLHLSHVAAGSSSGPRIVPLARPGTSLSSGDNESLALAVFLHRLRAAQIANVPTVQLSEIVGVPLPDGMMNLIVAVPRCFALRVLDHQIVAGSGPRGYSTLVSTTRAALTAAPLTTAAAFVNCRGAKFGDCMLVLPEINIIIQEKQSVIARQKQAAGATVPLVPPHEVVAEVEKIDLAADLLPALIVFVSDNRARDNQVIPENTVVVATPELRCALLGSLVSGLRARSLEENETRATLTRYSAHASAATSLTT